MDKDQLMNKGRAERHIIALQLSCQEKVKKIKGLCNLFLTDVEKNTTSTMEKMFQLKVGER